MTRTMGDATHDMVPQLAAIRSRLQLVAGYDTGSPDIDWTAADVAQFSGLTVLMIDQGFTGSPNLKANIRDVEFGAWTPGQAVNRAGWNVPRPTIYCTLLETGYGLLTTPGVLADGWRGDLWLAIPGWQPGQPLPAAPGCTIVAVQNELDVANAYDLSVVLDPAWPGRDGVLMKILSVDRSTVPAGVNWPGEWLLRGDGTITHIQTDAELAAYVNAGVATVTVSYDDWKALAGVA